MELFKLVGSVFVDTEKSEKSLQNVQDKVKKVAEGLGNGIKTAAKWGAAVTAGAAAATTALVGSASSAASALDVIDKGSQRMNISAMSYQELAHAAGLCGVEMSELEEAAKTLQGTDLNMDSALAEIYELETAEERSARAIELFGESAYNMTPMLNASKEEMAAMRQEANDLGLVMDQDAVTAGAALNDSLAKVKDSLSGVFTHLTVELMPIVQEMCDFVIANLPMIQGLVQQLEPVLTLLFTEIVPPIMSLAQQLLPVISSLITAIVPPLTSIITSILPIVVNFFKTFMPPFIQLANAILPAVTRILNVVLPLLSKVADIIMSGIGGALNFIIPIVQKVGDIFARIVEGIPGAIKKALNGMIKFVNGLIRGLNKIIGPVSKVVNFLGGNRGAAPAQIPSIPALAKGGTITEAGAAIVNEAGPELVQLGKGAKVTPLSGKDGNFDELLAKVDSLIGLLTNMQLMGVYIDGTALVGYLAPGIDKALGKLAIRNGRRA